jgi:DMSO/TMAO reductase YedYZ heme-binding membrane subunit
VRRWIGVKVWRWLHRWTLAVYGLGIVHTLGSGTDAKSAWLLGLLGLTAAPIAIVALARYRPGTRRRSRRPRSPSELTATTT